MRNLMLADEKFDVYDKIVSGLDSGASLTYSPLIREAFLFCLKSDRTDFSHLADSLSEQPKLLGVIPENYPEKRRIKKIGYFYDEGFLKNILSGFKEKGISTVKLDLLKPQAKRVLSTKQEEEIIFFETALKKGLDFSIHEDMVNRFYLLNGMVETYYNMLKASGVDAIVFRVYYGLYYFPIILACKMLGITVVDIQHGINGFKHLAYSKFREGEVGSPLLPDVFWTWGNMATRMLERDSCITGGAVIIEGGNPVFSDAHSSVGQDNYILYTHQPQSKGIPVPYEEIKKVYGMVRKKVIIRPHPLHFSEAIEIREELRKIGVKAKVEDSRKVMVNDSLAQASVHVTYSSTCAIEALNFGVPTVYCSDYIGDVEKEFSTGLLFRIEEVEKDKLIRVPELAINYSLGSKERVSQGINALLALTAGVGETESVF